MNGDPTEGTLQLERSVTGRLPSPFLPISPNLISNQHRTGSEPANRPHRFPGSGYYASVCVCVLKPGYRSGSSCSGGTCALRFS